MMLGGGICVPGPVIAFDEPNPPRLIEEIERDMPPVL